MTNEHQQVIGLAAAIQALTLVGDVAFKGKFDETYARPLFQSLIHYSPDNAVEAYEGVANLRLGLQAIPNLLNNQANLDLIRHLFSVIVIEGKLVRSPTILTLLRNKLEDLRSNVHSNPEHFADDSDFFDDEDDDNVNDADTVNNIDLTSDKVVAEFAEIYKQTASTIEPRIMVKGEAEYLRNEVYANQIRALLFAALRGASFFRHNDGSRRFIMFKSKQYINLSKELLASH